MNELQELHDKVRAMFPEAVAIVITVMLIGGKVSWSAQAWATEVCKDGEVLAMSAGQPSHFDVLAALLVDARKRKGE